MDRISFAYLVLWAMFITLIYSCTKDIGELPKPANTGNQQNDTIQPCDTAVYTYSNAIKNILDNNCVVCHAAGITPCTGVVLDSYTGAKNASVSSNTCNQGDLLCAVKWTCSPPAFNMPYGGNKLPDSLITKIEKWINSGMCE